MFFGQVVQSPSLLTFLPTKPAGDRLLEHYFDAVHPIARCVHRPSFEMQYEGFWEEAAAGYEPRTSVQAVVFAAWLSAAVAMDENVINRDFGFTKADLVENMKIGTEVALSKANFLRTTKVETMQAFVMYLVSMSDPLSISKKKDLALIKLLAKERRYRFAAKRSPERILCLSAQQ